MYNMLAFMGIIIALLLVRIVRFWSNTIDYETLQFAFFCVNCVRFWPQGSWQSWSGRETTTPGGMFHVSGDWSTYLWLAYFGDAHPEFPGFFKQNGRKRQNWPRAMSLHVQWGHHWPDLSFWLPTSWKGWPNTLGIRGITCQVTYTYSLCVIAHLGGWVSDEW